ncbi:MAG: cytochrome c biogenesis protein CcsA [Vampirovibrionales bacterium]|nr:cytochrome c biogenesis protein CcsA [Vampirovibrionales bacterium]
MVAIPLTPAAAEPAFLGGALACLGVGLLTAIAAGVCAVGARRRLDRLAWLAYALGAFSALATLVARSLAAGALALSNMYESLLGVTLALLVAALLMRRFWTPRPGKPVETGEADGEPGPMALWAQMIGLLALGALSYAATLPREIAPLMPALQSYWRAIHVPAVLTAYALLTLAFASAAGYLIQDARRARPETLALWDELTYRCVAIAFPVLAIGVMLGALWANEAWGRYWSWDPKESMSLATLLTYGAYLHLRLNSPASARALAWTAVAGFAMTLLTYFGVNALGVGLHTYGKLGGSP